MFGYFPKPSKIWVIVKPEYEEQAKRHSPTFNLQQLVRDTLGTSLGPNRQSLDLLIIKVKERCRDLKQFSEIATR